MEIWETIAQNDAVINMLKKSEEDRAEARRLTAESKDLEHKALTAVLESRGIRPGRTIVRNKKTGALGVIFIKSSQGIFLEYYNLAFHTLTKAGTVSKNPSLDNRPHNSVNLMDALKLKDAQGKLFYMEAMADALEVTGTEIKSDEE